MKGLVFAAMAIVSTAAAVERDQPIPLERLAPGRKVPAVACPPGDTVWLDSILRRAVDRTPIPGMATMIVQDGEVVWNRCYGYAILGDSVNDSIPVTDTTCFTLASLSKTFTALGLMQLWENGRFELDGDINDSLPFTVRHSRFPDSTITYRMLLTHTAAVKDNWSKLDQYYGPGDPDSSLRTLCENYFIPGRPAYDSSRNFFQYWPPGGGCHYSNAGFTLAGYVVEALADSFPALTRDSIFRRLGMNRTTWLFADLDTMSCACQYGWAADSWIRIGHRSGSFFPASFLKSCTRDLGTYLKMWLAYGRHDSVRLLDSATVALMMTPYVYSGELGRYMGMCWYQDNLNGDTVWCHGGSWEGVATYFAISRRDNSGIIALTNGGIWSGVRDDVVPALHEFAARPGIAERPGPGLEWRPRSAFVRGMLELTGSVPAALLDISGSRVADLAPGLNDLRHLAPGIYFVRAAGPEPPATSCHKVIVTR